MKRPSMHRLSTRILERDGGDWRIDRAEVGRIRPDPTSAPPYPSGFEKSRSYNCFGVRNLEHRESDDDKAVIERFLDAFLTKNRLQKLAAR